MHKYIYKICLLGFVSGFQLFRKEGMELKMRIKNIYIYIYVCIHTSKEYAEHKG